MKQVTIFALTFIIFGIISLKCDLVQIQYKLNDLGEEIEFLHEDKHYD